MAHPKWHVEEAPTPATGLLAAGGAPPRVAARRAGELTGHQTKPKGDAPRFGAREGSVGLAGSYQSPVASQGLGLQGGSVRPTHVRRLKERRRWCLSSAGFHRLQVMRVANSNRS